MSLAAKKRTLRTRSASAELRGPRPESCSAGQGLGHRSFRLSPAETRQPPLPSPGSLVNCEDGRPLTQASPCFLFAEEGFSCECHCRYLRSASPKG